MGMFQGTRAVSYAVDQSRQRMLLEDRVMMRFGRVVGIESMPDAFLKHLLGEMHVDSQQRPQLGKVEHG